MKSVLEHPTIVCQLAEKITNLLSISLRIENHERAFAPISYSQDFRLVAREDTSHGLSVKA